MTGKPDVTAVDTGSFEAASRSEHPEQGPTLGRSASFVGRREELEALYNAVRDTINDKRLHRVAVIGEPGVGKTRLVEEFFELVESGTRRLNVVRCVLDESDGDGPLGILAAVLRGRFGIVAADPEDVARRKVADGVLALTGRSRTEEVRLLAAALGHGSARKAVGATDGGGGGDAGGEDWKAKALALGESLLVAEAQRRPLFLVIDGLRAAGDAAVAPLVRFCAQAEKLPVMLLLISRREVPPALRKAQGEHRAMALGPLPARETERLARNVLDGVRGEVEPLIATLVQKSGGNPGLLLDVLRVMALRGIVGLDSVGAWSAEPARLAEAALPGTIGESSKLRVRSLSERERGVLEKAAVIGQTFWYSAVLALMRTEPEAEPQRWWLEDVKQMRLDKVLLDVQARGMVAWRGAGAIAGDSEFTFDSSLDREALLAGIPEDRLRTYQRVVGRWMLHRRPGTGEVRWFRTAGELLRAGGDPLGAAEAWLLGAWGANEALAGDAALALCTAAIELLRPDDLSMQLAAYDCLAEVHVTRRRWSDAADALRAALRLSVGCGDRASGARAWRRLGEVLLASGSRDAARGALEAAARLLAEEGDLDGAAEAQRALRELTGRAPAGRIRADRRSDG